MIMIAVFDLTKFQLQDIYYLTYGKDWSGKEKCLLTVEDFCERLNKNILEKDEWFIPVEIIEDRLYGVKLTKEQEDFLKPHYSNVADGIERLIEEATFTPKDCSGDIEHDYDKEQKEIDSLGEFEPVKTVERKCVNCKFEDHSFCHRLPPVIFHKNLKAKFPETYDNNWCGEFKPK